MELNMGTLKVILVEKFDNNQAKMANDWGISRFQLNAIFKSNGKNAGKKIFGAVLRFCKKYNYNYEDFIFF